MNGPVFIADIACRLGEAVGVEALARQGAPDAVIEDLRARGFARFHRFDDDGEAAWTECIAETLTKATARGVAVDTILIANDPDDRVVDRRRLLGRGLDRAWLVGMGLQHCAAVGGALRLAGGLVRSGAPGAGVMVIVSGAVGDERRRVSPQGDLLFSDGVVSFVVNGTSGEFELLSSVNAAIAAAGGDGAPVNPGRRLRDLHQGLKAAFATALDGADLSPDRIDRVFATHAGGVGQMMVASAGRFAPATLEDAGLARHGHVFGCDEVVGLEEGLRSGAIRPGDAVFMTGWSDAVVSACVLRATGVTPNGRPERAAAGGEVEVRPAAVTDEAGGAPEYAPPQGETEAILARLWAEALGLDRVGRHDNFIDLGGYSLAALRLISRLRQALGVEVTVATLIASPVLADMAEAVSRAAATTRPPIAARNDDSPAQLSFAQQRLWFLAQMEGGDLAYRIPLGLRLRGGLDAVSLRRALDRLAARHEALRATIVLVDDQPVQRIAPEDGGFSLQESDLRPVPDAEAVMRRLATAEVEAPFDLASGPLARGRLIRLADDDHALIITLHHIVADGWSMGVLINELSALYAAFQEGRADPLPPLTVQYSDYAAWQRRWLSAERLRTHSDYWRAALANAPAVLELQTDRPRPASWDQAGASAPLVLDERLTAGLKALGQRRGVSLFMVLLAGWAAVLARLSGQDEVVIGAPAANRGHVEIEPLIGFFVNSLALRLDLSGSPTVAVLLERVRTKVLEAQQHQELPFEQVVDIVGPPRSLGRTPLFQAMFAWQNNDEGALVLPGLTVSPMATPGGFAKYDLTLGLAEADGRIVGGLEYATALFDEATIERHLGYLRRLLEAMAAEDPRTIDRLPILSDAERRRLVFEWNDTEADYPEDTGVQTLFEARATRHPDAVAIAQGTETLTYGALNVRAGRLAGRLARLGVRPGDTVAIGLDRSAALVVAELAILKCGAAYAPLDLEAPAARQALILEDCRARILVTDAGRAVPVFAGVTRVDVDAPTADAVDAPAPATTVTGGTVAYVMYTSGSTGRPKGVMIPHRAIARLALNNGYADFRADDRVAFAANPAFDASTLEVWAPLLNGGRVVVIDQDTFLDPPRLARAIREQGVTALWLTASIFNLYTLQIPEALAGLRLLLTGGEAADPSAFERMLRHSGPDHLINGYGPTETTTFAMTHDARGDAGRDVADTTSIPVGRPISNTRVYILDAHGEPVPTGAVGQIHIGGGGVALGYLNRPAQTAQRFLPSPFVAGDRLYRTGDLGRYLPDGRVVFLGRNDSQVKIRGFRVELGEVEAELLAHPGVGEAAVLAREDRPGDKRLVAYYTAAPGGTAPDAQALRTHMLVGLPEVMTPTAFVRLDVLPLTPNGKLDRKALPPPEGEAFAAGVYEAPQGRVEETIARLWVSALGVDRVGRQDNFFEIGGHSLLGLRVLRDIETELGRKIPLSVLFSNPRLADLSRQLMVERAAQAAVSLVPLQTAVDGAPMFMIHWIERDLARHLGRRRPVYGLALGLAAAGGDNDVPSPKGIEAVARHYIDEMRLAQPRGPYHLIGHSAGGLIAYEMARRLAEAGEAVAFLGLLDTHAAGSARIRRRLSAVQAARNIVSTPIPALADFLTRRIANSIARIVLADRRTARLLPPAMAWKRRLIASIEAPYSQGPYAGRIDLFSSAEAPWQVRHEAARSEDGWRALAGVDLRVHRLPGGHMDMVKDPLAANAAEAIERALADTDSPHISGQPR